MFQCLLDLLHSFTDSFYQINISPGLQYVVTRIQDFIHQVRTVCQQINWKASFINNQNSNNISSILSLPYLKIDYGRHTTFELNFLQQLKKFSKKFNWLWEEWGFCLERNFLWKMGRLAEYLVKRTFFFLNILTLYNRNKVLALFC